MLMMANYSINNIVTYNITLNNLTRGFTIKINSTQDGNIGYFELNQSSTDSFLSISLFNSQNSNNSKSITYTSLNQPINKTFAKITFSRSSSWNLFLNSTFDFTTNANRTFNYNLTLYLPQVGYSYTNSINAYDNTAIILL